MNFSDSSVEVVDAHRRVAAHGCGEKVQSRVGRVAVLRTGRARQFADRQQPHLERGQRVVRRQLHVRRQRQRDVAAGVREVHIECAVTVDPAPAQQVADDDEGMRADQHAAGAEEPIDRQLAHDAVVLGQGVGTAERDGRARVRRQALGRLDLLVALDQRGDALVGRSSTSA
jgi:hypothetical protein